MKIDALCKKGFKNGKDCFTCPGYLTKENNLRLCYLINTVEDETKYKELLEKMEEWANEKI